MMDDKDLAEIMYTDYCEALGDQDNDKPDWLFLDPKERDRWIYVAEMVVEPVLNNTKEDLLKDINEMEDRLDEYRDTLWEILGLLKPILKLKVVDDLI